MAYTTGMHLRLYVGNVPECTPMVLGVLHAYYDALYNDRCAGFDRGVQGFILSILYQFDVFSTSSVCQYNTDNDMWDI